MLLSSEVFGIIAIGFALNFLRIIINDKSKSVSKTSMNQKSSIQEELESFIEIPMEGLYASSKLEGDN
ncbi:hypothetical protein [Maribacter aestuarii]|uniref:hypothetical protein n=1 Tax=Maribacter aestuarii TaxID=1130723 RepID=UPI00248BF7DB|nr:hypothetical protein [Maribacter aestuarii]